MAFGVRCPGSQNPSRPALTRRFALEILLPGCGEKVCASGDIPYTPTGTSFTHYQPHPPSLAGRVATLEGLRNPVSVGRICADARSTLLDGPGQNRSARGARHSEVEPLVPRGALR